ncbi:fused MFS/spermidine synthase [Deltaproteobacteria bacterium TL4]
MLPLIYVLFTLSGFIGLIYEATWSRYLKLFLGHSSYGQILTLCIFMGGLGLGAFIAGRYAKRVKNALYLYAVLELLIGVGGFLYHTLYLAVTEYFYYFASTYLPSALLANTVKILLSILITGPFAIILGMTFPAIAIGVIRLARDGGKATLSRLYFTNSFGATLGILVTSYFLIPNLGTSGSLIVAAYGNILLAIGFYGIAKRLNTSLSEQVFVEPSFAATPISLSPKPLLWLWLVTSFLTGFSSFLYEIGWIRLLSMMLGSSTHSFDIMVSAFIFGIAGGAFFVKRLLTRATNTAFLLGIVQVCMGLCAIISIYLYAPFFKIVNESNLIFMRTLSGYHAHSVFNYFLCLLLMFPTSFFAGMTLPIITFVLTNLTRNEQYTGTVYGWNTVGAVTGAVLGGLVILPVFQLKETIALGGFIDILLGLAILAVYHFSKIRFWSLVVVVSVISLPVLALKFDALLLSSGPFRKYAPLSKELKVHMRDGKTATIAFAQQGDTLAIITNGKPDASISISPNKQNTDEYTQAAVAFYSMFALGNRPFNAAMIGIGSGMTAHYLLGHPALQHLDLIEIEPEVYHMAKGLLPHNRRVYESPKVSVVYEDARTYFYTTPSRYDLIISVPSNPWVSGISSLFTEEFYRHIQNSLTDKGLLAQWIHIYEFNTPLLLSIIKAIDHHFPVVKLYHVPQTPDIVILASQTDVQMTELPGVMEIPGLQQDFNRLGRTPRYFGPHNYIVSTQSLKYLLKDVNSNSDYFPLVDNNAELAFFLKSQVDLFEPFVNSLFYYQEVLEPRSFPSQSIREPQAGLRIDSDRIEYLRYLLNHASPQSSWNEIDHQLHETLPYHQLRTVWTQLDIISSYRDAVQKGWPPLKNQLKFLFLDHAIQQDMKALPSLISQMLNTFSFQELDPQIIRAIAVQCLQLNDPLLLNQVLARFVFPHPQISDLEKKLLQAIRISKAQEGAP